MCVGGGVKGKRKDLCLPYLPNDFRVAASLNKINFFGLVTLSCVKRWAFYD